MRWFETSFNYDFEIRLSWEPVDGGFIKAITAGCRQELRWNS